MAKLSYITIGPKTKPEIKFNIFTDESVGAMLFDISGFSNPFDSYPLLYHQFKDNSVNRITNMDDAALMGIEDNGFMNGLLYYHVSQFYKFVGRDQPLYIVIADCSNGWDVIQEMQYKVNGRLFQVGIWTSQPIWKSNTDGSIGFSTLITDIQSQADEINGKVNKSAFSMVPLNIVLCGNSNYIGGAEIDYRAIPDAIQLNCSKVSVPLLQNGSKLVHDMQAKNPNKAPVSSLGLIMACLSVCGAEESIASLKKCDLNKGEEFNYPEWCIGDTGISINKINRFWANSISMKGYIIPMSYEGVEASYFLSSDQTLCNGDFSSIANNRVMHKCRRAICTALIPYINSHHIYSPGTNNISTTSIAIITDSINTIIDSVMKNKNGMKQVDGRVVKFLDNSNILENDTVSIKVEIKPANYSSYISEEISHSTM